MPRTGTNAEYSRRARKARKVSPWGRAPMCDTKNAKKKWREHEPKPDDATDSES